MAKKKKTVEPISICNGCEKIENFSFDGCAQSCKIFFGHLKDVVFAKSESPCKDFKCGVPGANIEKTGICEKCLLLKIYHARVENTGGKWKCVLGKKNVTRYVIEDDQRFQ